MASVGSPGLSRYGAMGIRPGRANPMIVSGADAFPKDTQLGRLIAFPHFPIDAIRA